MLSADARRRKASGRLSIQDAAAMLRDIGWTLHFDTANTLGKETTYEVTDPRGQVRRMTSAEIVELLKR